MASPEDIERAEELAFGLLQVPAAIWYGAKSAFSQAMPLTTQSYSDVFMLTRLYAVVGVIVYLILFGDATIKLLRQFRLMILGRLRPWGCIRKFMGFTEIRTDAGAEHDDVIIINVPLTGFASQIILMFLLDMSVAFLLSIFWLAWVLPMFMVMLISFRQPKSYYEHAQSIRGRYEGVPRVAITTESPTEVSELHRALLGAEERLRRELAGEYPSPDDYQEEEEEERSGVEKKEVDEESSGEENAENIAVL
jgi:hypothetical protein